MKFFRQIEFRGYHFRIALIVLITLLVIQAAADMFDWYYIFPKLDTPMHILGGLFIGFFSLSWMPRSAGIAQKTIWVFCWVLTMGILVETSEWTFDKIFHSRIAFQLDFFDTYTDLLHDMIGGAIAYTATYFRGRL